MHSNQREEIKEAYAGEIVAIVGLKDTITGDTLCDEAKPIVLEKITFPEPVISLAIEPKTKSDQEKLGFSIKRLTEEDPTFSVKTNHETGQTIISGMGELQLEIMVDRMKREFGVEANVGAPQVAYKETIKEEAKVKENISSNQEDVDNMDTVGLELNQSQEVRDMNLLMPLKVELFQQNLSKQLKKE